MLRHETARFIAWANEDLPRSAEWETEYLHWPELYAAVEAAIETPPLDSVTIDLLLYVLARDNECQTVLEMLQLQPTVAHQVGLVGLNYPDPDARWQIAVLFGRLATPTSIATLEGMLGDPHEYVRRMALFEIRVHEGGLAEQTALSWLSSPHEYSRLAALDTLDFLRSSHVAHALEELRHDPSGVVRGWVEKRLASQAVVDGV